DPLQQGPYEFGDPMLAWGETHRDREEANQAKWDHHRRWRGWSRHLPAQGDDRPWAAFAPVKIENEPIRLGDRILVLKYMYLLREPQRFDVVVFKNPTRPDENFIKRLVGLPGEILWLLDGDIFRRPVDPSNDTAGSYAGVDGANTDLALMSIQRKPVDVQRNVWIPIFDSQYIPENIGTSPTDDADGHGEGDERTGEIVRSAHDQRSRSPALTATATAAEQRGAQKDDRSSRRGNYQVPAEPGHTQDRDAFRIPWFGEPARDWSLNGRRSYRLHSDASAVLRFDTDLCPLDDRLAYNVTYRNRPERIRYHVADLRIAATIRPDVDELRTAVELDAHRHTFRARIESDGTVAVEMRPDGISTWTILATAQSDRFRLKADRATPIEFWHVDQALWLWIDNRVALHAPYEWTADERLAFAYGWTPEELERQPRHALVQGRNEPESAALRWRFSGSPLTMHRVQIDRDLYFRPQLENDYGPPARASHPENLAVLNEGEFFVCGDNSSASLDSRRLGEPVPWVQHAFVDRGGIIPRRLLIGKAFFVYFPSPESIQPNGRRLIPNFGEMRLIH
ncbi:MAG: signal peptidase I, partial [Planctomycetota bacterium]